MKFKSDNQRKAVFANMFNNNGGKRTKVGSQNVKNFDTGKRGRQQSQTLNYEFKRIPSPTFGPQRKRIKKVKKTVELKPKVDVKSGEEHCKQCKRKGLNLTSGECAHCIEEKSKFVQPEKRAGKKKLRRRPQLDPDLEEALEEIFVDMERHGNWIWSGRYGPGDVEEGQSFYVEIHIDHDGTLEEVLFWDNDEESALGTISRFGTIHTRGRGRDNRRLSRAMNRVATNLSDYFRNDDE